MLSSTTIHSSRGGFSVQYENADIVSSLRRALASPLASPEEWRWVSLSDVCVSQTPVGLPRIAKASEKLLADLAPSGKLSS